MKVTKDNTIFEVLQMDEGTAPILMSFGMHCLGCPGARAETIERASRAHGMDCNALLDALNEYLEDKE